MWSVVMEQMFKEKNFAYDFEQIKFNKDAASIADCNWNTGNHA